MISEDGFEFLDILGDIDEQHLMRILSPDKQKKTYPVIYHLGRKIACLIIILFLSLCGIFHKQVEVAAKRIISYITEVLGVSENLIPYTEIIGTSIEKDGITVYLEEAIVTPNAILVAVDVEGAPEGYGVGDGNIIINENHQIPDVLWGRSGGLYVENNIHIIVWEFLDEIPYLENNEIQVEIVLYKNHEDAVKMNGIPFVFEFCVTKEEIYTQVLFKELDEIINIDDYMPVKLCSFSNDGITSQVVIEMNPQNESELNESLYYIFAVDSFGNRAVYNVKQQVGNTYIFRTNEHIPLNSEWVEMQLCTYFPEYQNSNEKNQVRADDIGQQSEVFEIDLSNMNLIGDPFRIDLTE